MPKKSVLEIEIRRALRKDISALVRLRIALLKEVGNVRNEAGTKELSRAIRRHFVKELPAGRYVGFIARANGAVVACGGLTFYARPPYSGNPSGKEAYLMGMYTLPNWRGKGTGAAVLRKILDFAKARDVRRVWLHSEPGARSLYGREGFRANDSYMELTR